MKHLLDKGGALGALMAAVAAPCCFPLLAPIGFALGFGALLPWAEYVLYGVAACAVVAMVGNTIAFRSHHRLDWAAWIQSTRPGETRATVCLGYCGLILGPKVSKKLLTDTRLFCWGGL